MESRNTVDEIPIIAAQKPLPPAILPADYNKGFVDGFKACYDAQIPVVYVFAGGVVFSLVAFFVVSMLFRFITHPRMAKAHIGRDGKPVDQGCGSGRG